MDFRVAIDGFSGPLDLLLYLVRKEEVEVVELSLAHVIRQYLEHVEALEKIEADSVGDFLELATVLIEIKSRRVLPESREDVEQEETVESQDGLVERLLEYREFRELAERLEARSESWRSRRQRLAPPPRSNDKAELRPIEQIEIWDLVSAFARLMRERLSEDPQPATIRNDDTPVHIHMQRIDRRLRTSREPTPFADLFAAGPLLKSTLMGVFLAVLELVRHRHAIVRQPERFGPIVLVAGPEPLPADFGAPAVKRAG